MDTTISALCELATSTDTILAELVADAMKPSGGGS